MMATSATTLTTMAPSRRLMAFSFEERLPFISSCGLALPSPRSFLSAPSTAKEIEERAGGVGMTDRVDVVREHDRARKGSRHEADNAHATTQLEDAAPC